MFLHPCVREKRLRQLSNHPVLKPQFNIGALAPRPRPPSHHSAGWYIREGGRLKHLNSVPDDAERLILPKLTPGWPRNLTGRARSAPLRGWNVQSCSGESRLSPYTDDDPPLQKLFATLCGRSPGRSRQAPAVRHQTSPAEIWRRAFRRSAGSIPEESSRRAAWCRARALLIGTSGQQPSASVLSRPSNRASKSPTDQRFFWPRDPEKDSQAVEPTGVILMPAEGLEDLNPRPTVYKTAIKRSMGLLINHLQRLPAPLPGPSRHNYGTPNVSSTHSWHRTLPIG